MGIIELVPAAREYLQSFLKMKLFVRSRRREEPFLVDDTLLSIFKFIVDKDETLLPPFLSLLNKS